MAHHVIYVPGLGDKHSYGQPTILKVWRLFGVRVHYVALGWADDTETFDTKLNRLLKKIDDLVKDGHQVSLACISAGATAALNAYALRPELHAVVCICGKIKRPESVGQIIYKMNPPFKESIYLLQKNLPKINSESRKRILSINSAGDRYVPPPDTRINGANEIQVNISGHIPSIYYCLIFKAATICKFIKKAGN